MSSPVERPNSSKSRILRAWIREVRIYTRRPMKENHYGRLLIVPESDGCCDGEPRKSGTMTHSPQMQETQRG